MTADTSRDLKDMTAADWTRAITRALEAHDVSAVAALIATMAVYHPRAAEALRLTLLLGANRSADDESDPRR